MADEEPKSRNRSGTWHEWLGDAAIDGIFGNGASDRMDSRIDTWANRQVDELKKWAADNASTDTDPTDAAESGSGSGGSQAGTDSGQSDEAAPVASSDDSSDGTADDSGSGSGGGAGEREDEPQNDDGEGEGEDPAHQRATRQSGGGIRGADSRLPKPGRRCWVAMRDRNIVPRRTTTGCTARNVREECRRGFLAQQEPKTEPRIRKNVGASERVV